MPSKYSSIDTLPPTRNLDEALALASSNEAQLQTLENFMESVVQFHGILRDTLLHRNELVETMTDREIMEAARVNHKQTTLTLSGFHSLGSFEDERLWVPPIRTMRKLVKGASASRNASTNYYNRNLLVTDAELDADMVDFDAYPDICCSGTVGMRGTEIECVEDNSISFKWLRKEFVINALQQMPMLRTFVVSSNFSLVGLPRTLMHVVGHNLTTLDLSFNQLNSIPLNFLYNGAAPAFPLVERLILNNNRIRPMLPVDIFRGDFAPNLSHINVENNSLVGFTSHLLAAVKRGSLRTFECCNNDFPDEEEDFGEMAKCTMRAAVAHPSVVCSFEQFSADVVEDVVASRYPVCVAAMHVLEEQIAEYYALESEGKTWEAGAMCPRCGVCDEALPGHWSAFARHFQKDTSTAPLEEPNFFDDDVSPGEGSSCSLIDTAVLVSSLCHWGRRMAEERQFDLESGEVLVSDVSKCPQPPMAMYKPSAVLGTLQLPIIFFTCGRPSCVDDIVDIVGGGEAAITDFRVLRYDSNGSESDDTDGGGDN